MNSTRKIPASRRALSLLASLAVIAVIVIGAIPSIREEIAGLLPDSEQDTAAPAEAPSDDVYYEVLGTAEIGYDATEGEIDYCPMDDLDRAVCAYGELTYELRAGERGADRESITKDPAGWGHNEEIKIHSISDEDTSYSGYMYNRSHLVADSLGGHPDMDNMVTGTRMQNVGFNGSGGIQPGGMAYTESIARDYLDSDAAKECSLYYAATPNYSGDELLPRTVTVDIQSCDKSIDERVEVANTANGFEIDYTDGSFAPVG